MPRYATHRLAGTTGAHRGEEIQLLTRYGVNKKEDINVHGPIPKPVDSWPREFHAKDLSQTRRQKEILLETIETCFAQRLEFRYTVAPKNER